MTYATLDWAKAAQIIGESGARNADAGIFGDVVTPILRDGVPTEPVNRVLVYLRDGPPAVRIGGPLDRTTHTSFSGVSGVSGCPEKQCIEQKYYTLNLH